MNEELISKWRPGSLQWKRVIIGKYEIDNRRRLTTRSLPMHGQSLWKDIQVIKPLIEANLSYKLGRGTAINYWTDRWCGKDQLWHSYPLV